jgi:hypothetical protein
MVVGSIDWTNVLVALIAGLPAIIAAFYAARTHQQVKTPSGKNIGAQVEDALHTGLANNYRLQSIGAHMGAETPPQANGEATKVEGLADPADGLQGPEIASQGAAGAS